jgi:hypothetical protein
MGVSSPEPPERRYRTRAHVIGTAIVLADERYVGTFLIENVSASGALLAGDSLLSVGDQVRVLLQIRGCSRVAIRAKISRRSERDGQQLFALSFQVPPTVQDYLQNAALQVQVLSPLTLVVEENAELCDMLTGELLLTGRSALAVHTTVDAIGWLHAPSVSVEAVAVGTEFADMGGLDLLEFIALDFPNVRRVLIVSANQNLVGGADAAHSVLRAPWDPETLQRAFAP